MSGLTAFAPGWNLDVPAGTYVVRADVFMNQRPGAGGFAAILEASDLIDTVIIRGGEPDTTTDDMISILVSELAKEIRGNRAVILTRSVHLNKAFSKAFKPFKMLRLIANSPIAVADATRHAAVMAERAQGTRKTQLDRLLIARFDANEDFVETQDAVTVHKALQSLLRAVETSDLANPAVAQAAQDVLEAADGATKAKMRKALRNATANDVKKPTREY